MNYQEVLKRAKETMAPRCKVCTECNGIACRGISPGPGGRGLGRTFQRNYQYLADHVKIHMNVLAQKEEKQNTEVTLFSKTFAAPVFCAPIGMPDFTYTPFLNDETYAKAVVAGAKEAGIVAFTGGGAFDKCFFAPLEVTKHFGGWAIPTLKPWKMDVVKQRIALAEEAGVFAIAMDVDGIGLQASIDDETIKPIVPKSQQDLKEIVSSTKLPFVVKGIMTAKEAIEAVEAGVYGIVVSNHGGRVIEDGLSTAEMLPEIKKAVGDAVKVFVDGGVRTGSDVFKMIALGADGVLIGRPYAIAAYGAKEEGVRIYTEKVIKELKQTMLMTGCFEIKDITMEKIKIVP